MKVFFTSSNITDLLNIEQHGAMNFLVSFHYHHDKKSLEVICRWIKEGKSVLLDSSAFTAHTLGIDIKLNDYIQFVKKLQINNFFMLDVVGNSKETWNNYTIMIKEGLKPIPVYHCDNPIEYMEEYIKAGNNYIGLGGLASQGTCVGKYNRQKLDYVWRYILKNHKDLKVHGFGICSIEMAERFPWYSIDNSKFTVPIRFGFIEHPYTGKRMHIKDFLKEQYGKTKDEKLLYAINHPTKTPTNRYIRSYLEYYSIQPYLELEKRKLNITDYSHLTSQNCLEDYF